MDFSPIQANLASPITMAIAESRDMDHDMDLSKDQLCALLATEVSYQMRCAPCQLSVDQKVMTDDWVKRICLWAFNVCDRFKLDRSIVSVAKNLLDRFLMDYEFPTSLKPLTCHCISCKRSFDSRTFQLASMACLYIAIKVNPEVESEEEAERRRNFRLAPFVEFSRGLFDQQDVLDMEVVILQTIKWKVFPPTSTSFVPYLLDLLPAIGTMPYESRQCYTLVIQVLKELARYLSELAVCVGKELSSAKPSHVAFTSLLVAMELLTHQALPTSARTSFCDSFLRLATDCDHDLIETMRCKLMAALWPEMLLDAQAHNEPNHPIALANYYGLLDLTHIQKHQKDATTPPASPLHNPKPIVQPAPKSPVSISNPPTY